MIKLTVRNPVADHAIVARPLAHRPLSLDRLRIGLWWNLKYGGDVALETLGEQLRDRFNVSLQHGYHPYPAPPAAIAMMVKQATAVVGATGD